MSEVDPSEDKAFDRLTLPWAHTDLPTFHHVGMDDLPFFATFWPAGTIQERTRQLSEDDYPWRLVHNWLPSSGYNVLKGVQLFVDALFQARADVEIQQALWIQAHLHELGKDLPEGWRGDGYRLIHDAERSVERYLESRNLRPQYHYNSTIFPHAYLSVLGPPEDLYHLARMIHLHALALAGKYQLVYGGRLDENVVWFSDTQTPQGDT